MRCNDDMERRGLKPVIDPEVADAMKALEVISHSALLRLAANDWVHNLRLKTLLESATLDAEEARRESLALIAQRNENRTKQIALGKKMQLEEQARAGGRARSAKFEPVRQMAYQLAQERVPPSGRWRSVRQAVLAIRPDVIAFSEKTGASMSENQAEKTITGWLKDSPVAGLFASKQGTSASKDTT